MEKIIIELIRAELCEANYTQQGACGGIDMSDTAMLEGVYSLASRHDLAHTAGASLMKMGLSKDNPVFGLFRKARIAAVTRYEQLNCELSNLCGFLSGLKIDFIPLKGSAIRKYYPYPEMRTSCDIDILVHPDDLEKVSDALAENLGYTKIKEGSHDVQFISPSGINLELHFTLIEAASYPQMQTVLSRVWDYAVPDDEAGYRKILTPEFEYFYHISHMVKHFEYGGCGIRTLMDLWIYNHRSREIDRDELAAMLDEAGIGEFEKNVRLLSEIWFSGEQPEDDRIPLYSAMQEFIFTGGIYGNVGNRVKLERLEKESKAKYLVSRLILPYDRLKYDYPILKKHKVLMPFCEVHRWFRLLSKDTARRAVNEVKLNNGITEEGQAEMLEMLRSLGLR